MSSIWAKIGTFLIKISFETNPELDEKLAYIRKKIETELIIYLKDFLTFQKSQKPDFEIIIRDTTEIEVLKIKKLKKAYTPLYQETSDKKFITYPQTGINQFETILKNALFILLQQNRGFGIHASAAKVGSGAYLFLGKSGAGKSTIAQLIREKYQILSDDMTLVVKKGSGYFIFQTPFLEKSWWIEKSPKLYPIEKVFFLNKSKEFKAAKEKDKQIISRIILEQTLVAQYHDSKIIKEVLAFVGNFRSYYNLYFDKEEKSTQKLIAKIKNEKV